MNSCKHKHPILFSGQLLELEPDQEPFKSGELEKMDTINGFFEVRGRYCADCDKIIDIEPEDGK